MAGPTPLEPRAEALALLERLPAAAAALLKDHMRALAAEAVRQGMLLAGTLMMAARDVAVDFDSVARSLPAMRRYLPERGPPALEAGGDD